MPPRARLPNGVVIAAVLAIGGLVGVAAWQLEGRDPGSADPAPDRLAVLVLSADDHVERSTPAGWARARAGDALSVMDAIRAGDGATAVIALGRGTRVTLAERSEVAVRELTSAAQRLRLVRGRIGVDARADDGRVVRVEDRSGKIAAVGAAGRFGVLARGDALAIASTDGRVTAESGGGSVAVAPGQETVAAQDAAPLAPVPVPHGVVLRVARQLEERRASVCAVLHVDVAAELTVDGVPVEIPPDGTVVVRAPPGGGRGSVSIALRHAGGEIDRRELACGRAPADISDLEMRWHRR
jgi:hypothetical protein